MGLFNKHFIYRVDIIDARKAKSHPHEGYAHLRIRRARLCFYKPFISDKIMEVYLRARETHEIQSNWSEKLKKLKGIKEVKSLKALGKPQEKLRETTRLQDLDFLINRSYKTTIEYCLLDDGEKFAEIPITIDDPAMPSGVKITRVSDKQARVVFEAIPGHVHDGREPAEHEGIEYKYSLHYDEWSHDPIFCSCHEPPLIKGSSDEIGSGG